METASAADGLPGRLRRRVGRRTMMMPARLPVGWIGVTDPIRERGPSLAGIVPVDLLDPVRSLKIIVVAPAAAWTVEAFAEVPTPQAAAPLRIFVVRSDVRARAKPSARASSAGVLSFRAAVRLTQEVEMRSSPRRRIATPAQIMQRIPGRSATLPSCRPTTGTRI